MKKILFIVSVLALGAQVWANPLYKSCAGCHGAAGERAAMGKSKIINQMSHDAIKEALTGYKEGSYGGPLKSVMKPHVAKLTPEAIESLASYIVTLKK